MTGFHLRRPRHATRPRLPHGIALLVMTLALAGSPARSEGQGLSPGDRLRVTLPGPRIVVGTFQALTDTTLELTEEGRRVALRRATVQRAEQSVGRRLSVAGGIGGFLLGAAAGGAAGCLANKDSYGVFCGGQDDTKVIVGAALGGLAGAAVGAMIFRRERWRPIALGATPS